MHSPERTYQLKILKLIIKSKDHASWSTKYSRSATHYLIFQDDDFDLDYSSTERAHGGGHARDQEAE